MADQRCVCVCVYVRVRGTEKNRISLTSSQTFRGHLSVRIFWSTLRLYIIKLQKKEVVWVCECVCLCMCVHPFGNKSLGSRFAAYRIEYELYRLGSPDKQSHEKMSVRVPVPAYAKLDMLHAFVLCLNIT